MNNPLQKYFRQPKLFIDLPSRGLYTDSSVLSGVVSQIPVYGMTGMDQIILKSPDPLLSGESVISVIQSCYPTIKSAWELATIDVNTILLGMRIATFGQTMQIAKTCDKCKQDHEYDIPLSKIIDYFKGCTFSDKININGLTIGLKPLTYKQSTEYSLWNFNIQQKTKQINNIENEKEKTACSIELFNELGLLQYQILANQIAYIDTGETRVGNFEFILEWIENIDQNTLDQLRTIIRDNHRIWDIPDQQVMCGNEDCRTTMDIHIELDPSAFFDKA